MKGFLIREIIEEQNSMASLLPIDFDKALIGYGRGSGKTPVAIYDTGAVLRVMIEDKGMSEVDAFEHWEKSMEDGYPSIHEPIFINDFRDTKEANINLGAKSVADLNIN